MKTRATRQPQSQPKATVLSLPETFDEGVLVNTLTRLYQDQKVVQPSDRLEALNFLLSRFGVKLNLQPGCGVDQVREALAIVVEEHNKCRMRQS